VCLTLVGGDNWSSSGIDRSGLRGIGDRLLLMHILGISVVELLADLLGEGKVDVLAGRGSKLGDALLVLLNTFLNLRDSDTLLSSQILTADSDEVNGLVDTGLLGLREGNLDSGLNRGDNWDIVASLLGNLLAVVVTIAVVAVARGGLADSHHLGVTLLLIRHLHSFGSSVNNLLLVRVDTDLIGDNLHRLTADCTGYRVALFNIYDPLYWDFNVLTDCFKSWGAHFSRFNNINNRAVVLGFLVDWGSMVNRGSMVNNSSSMVNNRGSMVYNRGSMVYNRGSMVNSMGSMVDSM